jgi:hypothetical protein
VSAPLERLLGEGLRAGVEKISQFSGTPWEAGSAQLSTGMPPEANGKTVTARLSCKRPFKAEIAVSFSADAALSLTQAVVGAAADAGSSGAWRIANPDEAVLGEFANILGQALIRPLADAVRGYAVLSSPSIARGAYRLPFEQPPLLFGASPRATGLSIGFALALALDGAELDELLKKTGVA